MMQYVNQVSLQLEYRSTCSPYVIPPYCVQCHAFFTIKRL